MKIHQFWSAIGIIMSSVCLSVCLSVTLCIVVKRYILQETCLKKRIGIVLCARRYNLATLSEDTRYSLIRFAHNNYVLYGLQSSFTYSLFVPCVRLSTVGRHVFHVAEYGTIYLHSLGLSPYRLCLHLSNGTYCVATRCYPGFTF